MIKTVVLLADTVIAFYTKHILRRFCKHQRLVSVRDGEWYANAICAKCGKEMDHI